MFTDVMLRYTHPVKDIKSPSTKVVSNVVEWEYNINRFDWFDKKGNSLTDYFNHGNLIDILENLNKDEC